MPEIFNTIAEHVMQSLSTGRGQVQFAATVVGLGLVAAASFVRTMVPLRTLTVASNVMLLIAGSLALSPVHMLVYLGLVPLNSWRLLEITRLTRRVAKASADGNLSGIWLKPYMRARRLGAGEVLFHKGAEADALYLLLEGTLELVEIGKTQAPEQMFGEISFFSPDRKRTLTARCKTDCLVLSIDEPAFKQLYFQSPKFAFQIGNLIASRLSADINRLQDQVQGLQGQLRDRDAPAATGLVGASPA